MDCIIIIGWFIGIRIFDLVLFWVFAFRAIRRIRIPVVPPEIAPPIPRIEVKLIILKYSVAM